MISSRHYCRYRCSEESENKNFFLVFLQYDQIGKKTLVFLYEHFRGTYINTCHKATIYFHLRMFDLSGLVSITAYQPQYII